MSVLFYLLTIFLYFNYYVLFILLTIFNYLRLCERASSGVLVRYQISANFLRCVVI